MAKYFTNKLTVKGSVEAMKDFYLVLNSDSKKSTVDNFQMNKFVPIPEELSDENDWCEENWGCEADVEVLKVVRKEENEYCVMYTSVWEPNLSFVLKLHELYPNLSLTLEYANEVDDISETIEISNNKGIKNSHYYQGVLFKYLGDVDKYMFVEDSDDTDGIDEYYIEILGGNWKQSLSDIGYAINNVINWTELESFMKDYK